MNDTIKFSVRGKPIPKGSKRHVGHGIIIDANRKTKPWQQLCTMVAAEHAPAELWTGPVEMNLVFYLPKPGNVPKSRLGYPTTRPDLDKLTRAVKDALAGLIYANDGQVTDMTTKKRYGPIGVDVEVRKILTGAKP